MNSDGKVSLEETLNFINFLTMKSKEKSPESYIAIKNAINIFSIPTQRFLFKKSNFLYRAHNNDKTPRFFSDTRLGANRHPNTIEKFGRANEPGQSVFYCSDNCYVAYMETSHVVRNTDKPLKHKMTIGTWEVVEDLRLATLPSNSTIAGLNPTVDALHKNYMELVEQYRDGTTDSTLVLLDYFSRMFSSEADGDSTNYLISCAIANYYYENLVFDYELQKAIYLDGIIYPSVMLKTEGVNLALTYDTYNSREPVKLKLVDVVELTMVRVGDKTYEEETIVKCKSINQETGEILW
ncbi:MAG TPA: RES domain-containing protein [Chitinophagales bacterium]|nr:RES domain-containing protein [Chitinophagales bacterium]